MLFSIVIPTCNRRELLAKCLERVMRGTQNLEAYDYEVIVTDDGMDESIASFCLEKFPDVVYTRGPLKGPAANRNHGASIAKGDWLVFTDDDCLPDAAWLRAYSKAIDQNPDCKAFEGAILPDDWSLLKKDMAECPVNDKGGCFWSANIMVEKELFWNIEGFDEQFKIAAQEDQDLKWRLNRKTEINFIKNALVIHPVRFRKFQDLFKQIPIRTENFLYYANKNREVLGFKNSRGIIWHAGLKAQALSMLHHFKKGHIKTAIIRFYNFVLYIPKYLQPNH